MNRNLVAHRVSTVLDSTNLRNIGFELPHVEKSLPKIIKLLATNLEKAGGLGALEEVKKNTEEKYAILTKRPTTYSPIVK